MLTWKNVVLAFHEFFVFCYNQIKANCKVLIFNFTKIVMEMINFVKIYKEIENFGEK